MPRPEGRQFDHKFPPYDCVPGHEGWAALSRNLLSHGGKANENGDSLGHTILGQHAGGSNGNQHRGTPAVVQRSVAVF